MQKTLGGDRLGSGNRMKVELHNYERSTHNLGYLWRSTMSPGTLVPFMVKVALPGDTFDITLDCDMKTHPTIGPLFGSHKIQLDTFLAPIRLYHAALHNNSLGIGMKMSEIKLPLIELPAPLIPTNKENIDNTQINPSCLLAYLGLRGIGDRNDDTVSTDITRQFNALPLLAYFDIYKNYFSNKQEGVGAIIHAAPLAQNQTVTSITINGADLATSAPLSLNAGAMIIVNYTGAPPLLEDILVTLANHGTYTLLQLANGWEDNGTTIKIYYAYYNYGNTSATGWAYKTGTDASMIEPQVQTFDLLNIDAMREAILYQQYAVGNTPVIVNGTATGQPNIEPFRWFGQTQNGIPNIMNTQEGLLLKTYQSDKFNNWISTDWIDGIGGITEVTAIDTSSGSFTLDTLNLSRKVYNMLNRIAVSGGTYDDWIDAVYTHDRYLRAETPMYMGGLIKELVFQEVLSQASSIEQPLGTIGGRGVLNKKHKGGNVTIKVDEPSYIIGLISITPRIDYSQGNEWDVHLKTMDDFHKPALDEIGFQELITEEMAWWDTWYNDTTNTWEQRSAGKQPAWLNYMTDTNKVFGNFAIEDNEQFMTLTRKYEHEWQGDIATIKDLTTYIDPVKFNNIFANTSLDAQNFWAQIAVDITARRKMSARVMPNL